LGLMESTVTFHIAYYKRVAEAFFEGDNPNAEEGQRP